MTVRRLDDGSVYEERYDELILSPGARAVKPELPGADLEQIFTLRTVEDTFRIHTYLQSHTPKRAVVIGGGFIGLEMAENLVHAGVQTTLLQRSGQVMPPAGSGHGVLSTCPADQGRRRSALPPGHPGL